MINEKQHRKNMELLQKLRPYLEKYVKALNLSPEQEIKAYHRTKKQP